MSALYYNTLFYGGTTRMSPLVGGFPILSSTNTTPGWRRNTCSASNGNTVSALGSSYCLTGGTPGSGNFGHAITGNKYDEQEPCVYVCVYECMCVYVPSQRVLI
jgi:hypothetical protein